MMTSITRWVLGAQPAGFDLLGRGHRGRDRDRLAGDEIVQHAVQRPRARGIRDERRDPADLPPGRLERADRPGRHAPGGRRPCPRPRCGRARAGHRASSRRRCPARESRPTPRPATPRSCRPMAARRSCSRIRSPTTRASAPTRTPRRRPPRPSRGVTIAGAPVHVTGVDALQNQTGGSERTRGPARVRARRLRRADRARVRVRLAARVRADADGDRLDHDHVPGPVGRDRVRERLDDRRVPGRADRARRGDRLLTAGGRALARGACPWLGRRRGCRPGDADRRSGGRVQRHHGRDRSAGDDRAAAAVPALDRLRRDADPADQRDRRDHAVADRAGQGR